MSGRLDEAVGIVDRIGEELPKELAVEASCWLERLGRYTQALDLAGPLVEGDDRAKSSRPVQRCLWESPQKPARWLRRSWAKRQQMDRERACSAS